MPTTDPTITAATANADFTLETDISIDAMHGTVHHAGEWIARFELAYATPAVYGRRGLIRSGEEVPALCEYPGAWFTENGEIAQRYAVDDESTWRARDGQGYVYDVTITPSLVAYIGWTDDATVRAAIDAGAKALVLEDRDEIFVLDASAINITGVVDAEGDPAF